jgi:hypothetical protein
MLRLAAGSRSLLAGREAFPVRAERIHGLFGLRYMPHSPEYVPKRAMWEEQGQAIPIVSALTGLARTVISGC